MNKQDLDELKAGTVLHKLDPAFNEELMCFALYLIANEKMRSAHIVLQDGSTVHAPGAIAMAKRFLPNVSTVSTGYVDGSYDMGYFATDDGVWITRNLESLNAAGSNMDLDPSQLPLP